MASNTRKKLLEAEFFLKHLEENLSTTQEFNYYLSAFVSSARSVLWIMKKEFSSIESWKTWYDSIEPTEEELSFLGEIKNLRNRAEKIEPLKRDIKVRIFIENENLNPELQAFLERNFGRSNFEPVDNETDLFKPEVRENGATMRSMIDQLFHQVEEFPDDSIVKVAQRYVEWLDIIVSECERRFYD